MSSKRKIADFADSSAGRQGERHSPDSASGRASTKRQRVSRACDQCRAAREKCDGIQPLCYPCVSLNRPCTYQANPKKRGVQTGYIRTLELALAWVLEEVPGSEDALDALITHEGGQGRRLLADKDSVAAKRLHRKWRKSRVQRGIDNILSGSAASPVPLNATTASDSDTDEEDGHRPPSLLSQARISIQHSPHTRATSDRDSPKTALPLPPDIGLPLSASSIQTAGLRLPSNHWRLMDIYFAYTHCWLPILDKQEMFQTSYLYAPEEGLRESVDDPYRAIHAELWSALAVASFQDNATRSVAGTRGPGDGGNMTPDQVYDTARALLPSVEAPHSIHHTRALLLLALVNLGREKYTAASIFTGVAVRVLLGLRGQQHDLDGSSGSSRGPQQQQPQRLSAAFIACFILDTLLSIHDSIPAHLTTEDMVDAMHVSENDLDEWQPWTAIDGFGEGCDDPSRQSRNPAYCLSTFNQIYAIFKVLGRSRPTRRPKESQGHGHGLGHDSEAGPRQLQQAINLHAPFGPYLISDEVGSATVPSPYVLKTLYLWAKSLLDTASTPPTRLITGVISQYQKQFGACALPSIIGACVSSLASPTRSGHLPHDERERLLALRAQCSIRWYPTPLAPPVPYPESVLPTPTPTAESVNKTSAPVLRSLVCSVGHAAAHHQAEIGSGGSGSQPLLAVGAHNDNGSCIFPSNRQSRGLVSPAATVATQGTVGNTTGQDQLAVQAASTSLLGRPYPMPSRPNWSAMNTVPLDYDALLDDLASIDCTDGVETDPQFMANLGFAPGCDLGEIYSQSFAHL